MKIITIASQKGGAGKTTLATNLAIASSKSNKTTLLIDTDFRQRNSLNWFQKREEQDNPLVIEAGDQKTLFNIINLAKEKGVDRVFIDTKGSDEQLVNDAISQSDYCLITCGPGGFDVSSQGITASIAKRFRKKASFILSKAPARGQEGKETKAILAGLGFSSPEHQVTYLKAYRDAAMCGLSVLEYEPKGKASVEIKNLFEWLEKKLQVNPLLKDLEKGALNDE